MILFLFLGFDNTLHIVPALSVVDKTATLQLSTYPQQPYSTTQVTSYIIPFVGPHECPNSKKCPNHNPSNTTISTAADELIASDDNQDAAVTKAAQQNEDMEKLAEDFGIKASIEKKQSDNENLIQDEEEEEDGVVIIPLEENSVCVTTKDGPLNMLAHNAASSTNVTDKTGNNQVMATSFMASKTCPYPLSVVWWQTIDGMNRAVIGYSDGSICFVGLSPNCPFVASTAIESGSIMKLLICKDNTFESVMLLVSFQVIYVFRLKIIVVYFRSHHPLNNNINFCLNKKLSNIYILVIFHLRLHNHVKVIGKLLCL